MLCSCSAPAKDNARISFGAHRRAPAPAYALPAQPPQILFAQFSTKRPARETWWSGRVITGTNVASVVLSLPFFSFELPRRRYGVFEFRTFVQDVPPVYRRTLHGSIIAYNASGESVSRAVAVTFP